MAGNLRGIDIVFVNELQQETLKIFMTEKFEITLKRLKPARLQRNVVERLIDEGFINPN